MSPTHLSRDPREGYPGGGAGQHSRGIPIGPQTPAFGSQRSRSEATGGFGRTQARTVALALAAFLSVGNTLPAQAENAMGYQLMTDREAANLGRNHGALGLEVAQGRRISDPDLSFDLLQVRRVSRSSPGEVAGLRVGDQIIAVNGRVFSSLRSFAAYVGSLEPGAVARIDFIPQGGGPSDARRVEATVGQARAERPEQGASGYGRPG